MSQEAVFLGCPTHNGLIDHRMARSFYITGSQERPIQFMTHQTSLLAGGCNDLWCKALNSRESHNLKWFAMLHADIVPESWWIDKLIAIADKHEADLLSVVVPIKDARGITSTAIGTTDNFQRYARLTQRQVLHESFPETFDVSMACAALQELPAELSIWPPGPSKLLVNTGCMVCRLDQPWSGEAYFTINDRVQRVFNQYIAQQEPEDWFFSRMVAELGGKVMATKAVKVEHLGTTAYRSDSIWGSDVDPIVL